MELVRYFAGEIVIILADGSRRSAQLTADEIVEGRRAIYRVSFTEGSQENVAESEQDFFEALKNLRLELERAGVLLCCFGASENVYPSGMQRSMGPAILAYKMRLGFPCSSSDIVNIFEADETVKPATVEQQEQFRQQWSQSFSQRS